MTRRLPAVIWFAVAIILAGPATGTGWASSTGAARGPDERIELPLEDGHLAAATLLAAMAEAMGTSLPPALAGVDWTIDVAAALDTETIARIRRATGNGLTLSVESDALVITVDEAALQARAGEAGRAAQVRWRRLSRLLGAPGDDGSRQKPAPAGPAHRPWGITFATERDPFVPVDVYAASHDLAEERVVILVHGLDDPGWMWRDMIPALRGAGYAVARMEYPNDGPIAEAADLFAVELIGLALAGVRRVDVVAHSMGGLVTRDVLTRRAFYGGDGRGGANRRFPVVDRLIMCGTPNHGSEMARLRTISEIKEQISRALDGADPIAGGKADGAGEAAVDLLPGSDFLRRLNARAAPSHTRMSIIAGRMSPFDEEDITRLTSAARDHARSVGAPAWLQRWLARADDSAAVMSDELIRGLGDGCVSIDSARLEGVDDFEIVEANHVGLIVNVLGEKTAPHGVRFALERLRAE